MHSWAFNVIVRGCMLPRARLYRPACHGHEKVTQSSSSLTHSSCSPVSKGNLNNHHPAMQSPLHPPKSTCRPAPALPPSPRSACRCRICCQMLWWCHPRSENMTARECCCCIVVVASESVATTVGHCINLIKRPMIGERGVGRWGVGVGVGAMGRRFNFDVSRVRLAKTIPLRLIMAYRWGWGESNNLYKKYLWTFLGNVKHIFPQPKRFKTYLFDRTWRRCLRLEKLHCMNPTSRHRCCWTSMNVCSHPCLADVTSYTI